MKIQNKIALIIISIILLINKCMCTKVQADQTLTTSNTSTVISSKSDSDMTLDLYSEAAVLIDSKTGKILYGKNEKEKMYPASTTKVLTAIIALEKCKLTDKITASYDAG